MMGDVVNLGARQAGAGLISGGELAHGSTEVWAINIMSSGGRAHFWHRGAIGYRRECDGAGVRAFLANGQSPLFEPGNYPKCRHCVKRLAAK